MATIPEIIEKIGFGRAQYVQLLLANATGLGSMCYLMLIMSLAKTIGKDFGLNVTQQALLTTMMLVGVGIGNFAAGPIGDAVGRRLPILCHYGGALVCVIATALSPSYYALLVVLPIMGFVIGQGQPNKTVLSGEIVPAEQRLHSKAADQVLIALGGVLACVAIWFNDPYMKELNWRWLIGVCCVPFAIGLVCAYFYLKESPSYLSIRMDYEHAEEVLDYMRQMNGKPDVDIEYEPPLPLKSTPKLTKEEASSEVMANARLVFGKHLLYTTLALTVGMFTAFLLYIGVNYAFLQEIPAMDMLGSPALNLMVGMIVEVPGFLAALALGGYVSRKCLSIIGLLASSSAILGFAVIVMMYGQPKAGPIAIALQVSYLIFKFFAGAASMAINTFAFEVYPTKARTFGAAVIMGLGRVGSMLGPVGYGWSKSYTGSFYAFMFSVVALSILSSALIFFISSDPKGQPLQDHLPEENYQPNMDDEEKEKYDLKLSKTCRISLTVVTAAARLRHNARVHHYGATQEEGPHP